MTRAIFVPGLAESLIRTSGLPGTFIWVDPAQLMLGFFGKLRLDADGTSPGGSDGVACRADGLLPPYAGIPLQVLGVQLMRDGWSVDSFPWDWRKSMLVAGDALAAKIRRDIRPADPCALVCHSAGGLVARRCWSNLVGTGEEGLIRKIVTLGTPSLGSYAAVEAFSASSNIITALYNFNNTAAYLAGWAQSLGGYIRWTREDIRDLLLTWPSLYEILPLSGGEDAGTDPHREKLFSAANWGYGARPQQRWLDHHRNVYAPWAKSAASKPPGHVMTCVAGTGHGTPARLDHPELLGSIDAIGYVNEGDAVLTVRSAQLSTATKYRVTCQHDNEFPELVNSGEVREWLLETFPPAAPTPPEEVRPAVHLINLSPVPGQFNTHTDRPGYCPGVEPCRC